MSVIKAGVNECDAPYTYHKCTRLLVKTNKLIRIRILMSGVWATYLLICRISVFDTHLIRNEHFIMQKKGFATHG